LPQPSSQFVQVPVGTHASGTSQGPQSSGQLSQVSQLESQVPSPQTHVGGQTPQSASQVSQVSPQLESQTPSPQTHVGEQLPPVHGLPQLSSQSELQVPSGVHWHVRSVHVSPVRHATPQPPQLEGSFSSSTHAPLHPVLPVGQQAPDEAE
jgi:hypothetical protein